MKKLIEMGPGLLYTVGKIFIQGVRFDIECNKSVHETINIENIHKKIYQSFLNKDGGA